MFQHWSSELKLCLFLFFIWYLFLFAFFMFIRWATNAWISTQIIISFLIYFWTVLIVNSVYFVWLTFQEKQVSFLYIPHLWYMPSIFFLLVRTFLGKMFGFLNVATSRKRFFKNYTFWCHMCWLEKTCSYWFWLIIATSSSCCQWYIWANWKWDLCFVRGQRFIWRLWLRFWKEYITLLTEAKIVLDITIKVFCVNVL